MSARVEPLLDALVAYDKANPWQTYRLRVAGRSQVGQLSVQVTSGPDGEFVRRLVRVKDEKRAPRSKYASVFERYVADGQLEVKVGARYVPFKDLRPASPEAN